jgi:5-methylcytosine-specific restriction endonuclease McrA
MKGESNPAWINGSSYKTDNYRGSNWDEKREECYNRDNYMCQICFVKCIRKDEVDKESNKNLIQCHHIEDYINKNSNELHNLVTLCSRCHAKVHHGELPRESYKFNT